MSKNNDSWGIDVGANAIKAIRLVRSGTGVKVADYTVIPFKRVLTTPDIDADEQVRMGLDQLLGAHDMSKSSVVVSVPGHMAFARFAKLPPVEPKAIPKIVEFEAVQQIPFPIEQVEWDYQVFSQPDSPDVEVGIFAITKEKINDFLENYQHVGLTIDGVTLSPLAVYNAIAYDQQLTPDSEGFVLMDIGTTSTDVTIFEAGNIWLRTLPIGGNNFTESLVQSFKLGFPKAEKLKREAGTSKYARQIFTAMRPVFADLVQELQRSLGYYQAMNREAKLERLIGLGSTFRLPGMQKFLKQQLQMDVVRPDAFKRISVEGKRASEFADHTINLATAYGLALLGLDMGTVNANILPTDRVRQRLWRSKQPWFAASAAVMVLPVLLMWGNAAKMGSSFDAQVKDTRRKEAVIQEARRFQSQYQELEDKNDPRQRITNLSRILDYREVWPKLMSDLQLAAAALDPDEQQLVLHSNDYEGIKKIGRTERRRIHIEQINAEYRAMLPGSSSGSEDGGDGGGGMGSEIWGDQGATDDGDVSDDGDSESTMATLKVPPSFLVTVRGWTSYTTTDMSAAAFISRHFIRWLETNNDRPDRPYRIKVDEDALAVGEVRVTDNNMVEGGGGARTSGRMPAVGGLGRRRAPGGLGMPGPRPGARGGLGVPRMSGGGGGNDAMDLSTDLAMLLPKRPVEDRPKIGDWEFTIRFTVQLTSPDDARKSETGGRTEPVKETDEPAEEPQA